jgi:hypothetical protein
MSRWQNEESAIARVSELLRESSLPLELETAEIVTKFLDDLPDKSDDLFFENGRLVYSPENDDTYREVDHVLTMYESDDMGNDYASVHLTTITPIECKSRRSVEFFAFSDPSVAGLVAPFPAFSIFTELPELVSINHDIAAFKLLLNAQTSGIRFKEDGKTPVSIHDENLIYNAGGSLYDFISADISMHAVEINDAAPSILAQLGVLDGLADVAVSQDYDSAVKTYCENLSDETCREFLELYHAETDMPFLQANVLYFPIVCVDVPIHEVAWEPASGIKGFTEIPFCAVTHVKHGWPGAHRKYIGRTAATVLFTNISHLREALDLMNAWRITVRRHLFDMPKRRGSRWPLELMIWTEANKRRFEG